MAAFEVSALGWGTPEALEADHICKIWKVSTQQSMLEVTLPAGTAPYDNWVLAPALLDPPLVLDPAEAYRLVCSLNFQDGDTFEMHTPDFILSSMMNSSMVSFAHGVQGDIGGSYPNVIANNIFGAPTFFIGDVPPQLLPTSSSTFEATASNTLFSAGFAASMPVVLIEPVQVLELGVSSTVCLCPPVSAAPQRRRTRLLLSTRLIRFLTSFSGSSE